MEKEKGSETAEIRFLKVSHELESIKQRSYGNHIMSTAYHPFSPPPKLQTLTEQLEDGKCTRTKS